MSTRIRITAKVTEEALPLGIGAVDNHVLDTEPLSVERCIVLAAISRTDRTVQVLNILKVDVVHQLTVQVDVVVSDLL